MNHFDLTEEHDGRRLRVIDMNGGSYYGTVELRVGGGVVFIWDVTNLPLGLDNTDRLEFIDEV